MPYIDATTLALLRLYYHVKGYFTPNQNKENNMKIAISF